MREGLLRVLLSSLSMPLAALPFLAGTVSYDLCSKVFSIYEDGLKYIGIAT
jgi:hypothetical protein